MQRPVLMAFFFCAIAGLAGCPIYDHDDDDGCNRGSDCGPGYACDEQSGSCYIPSNAVACRTPADCDATSTCTPSGQCMTGDCSFYNGCVAGYRCDSSSGVWQCVANDSGAAGEAGATSGEAGATSGVGAAAGQGGASPGAAGAPNASAGAGGA